jgi:hypothetical protein
LEERAGEIPEEGGDGVGLHGTVDGAACEQTVDGCDDECGDGIRIHAGGDAAGCGVGPDAGGELSGDGVIGGDDDGTDPGVA